MSMPPRPRWKPSEVESPSLIAEAAATYTNSARAFVVYRFGTIVFSDTNRARLDEEYLATLQAVLSVRQDFNVLEMNDHNLLVRFAGPVSGLVLRDFYDRNNAAIEEAVVDGGLLPGETVLVGEDRSVPNEHYYAGLYARAKLYCDIDHPQICVRFIPSE